MAFFPWTQPRPVLSPHPAWRVAALLLAAGLLGLCFPSGPVFWLPLAALIPFFLGLRQMGPRAGYAFGWAGGSLFWLASAFWLFHGCRELMGWSMDAAFVATLLFALYQGLPYGLAGLICGFFNQSQKPSGPLFSAGVLTLVIALWPALCPGSPAIALYTWPRAIQIADMGGIHLVLFFMLLSNTLLAETLASPSLRGKIRHLVLFLLLTALVLGYGSLRLIQLKALETAHPEARITIRTIQPDIRSTAATASLTGKSGESSLALMARITEQAALRESPPDLVLFPEAPGAPACDNLDLEALSRTERLSQSPILLPCTEYVYDKKKIGRETPDPENTAQPQSAIRELRAMHNALLLLEKGEIRQIYRKTRLVPFSEATPLGERWTWLRNFLGQPYEYTRGPGPDLIRLAGGPALQPLICFESAFPEIARSGVAMGAEALVTVANDGWFLHRKAAETHLGLALFRAVEQRRPMARATNTGMGAHIRATGEIEEGSLTPMHARTYRQTTLYAPDILTPYQRMGDLWQIMLALFLFIPRIPDALRGRVLRWPARVSLRPSLSPPAGTEAGTAKKGIFPIL